MAAALVEVLKDTFFVVVVWDTARLDRATAFQAGFAAGTAVPIAVLDARVGKASASADVLLDVLLPAPRLHAQLNNLPILVDELKALLPSLAPIRQTTGGISISNAKGQQLSSFDSALERQAANALLALDATLTNVRGKHPLRPDFLARIPGLEPPFNPVVVEVARPGLRPFDEKLHQVEAMMSSLRGRLALLVCGDEVEFLTLRPTPGTAILQVSLRELEANPTRVLLALRAARNAIVHGAA